jgi:hypothetical protein
MSYRILSSTLYATAEAAQKFFKGEKGLTRFKIEEPIDPNVEYCPTLSVITRDYCIVCIEVSEFAYSNPLDAFVLECKNRNLPVKLFVAKPKASNDPDFKKNLQRAKSRGVGLIELDDVGGEIIEEALILSLTGLRDFRPNTFPIKYRNAISDACSTFRNGNPLKACSMIYDEIEALTRRIADKTRQKGFWRAPKPGQKAVKINIETQPWAKVVEVLMDNLEYRKCGCPDLNDALLSRIRGITSHRNDAGHKPRTGRERVGLDTKLRTRFETAVDLLSETIAASRALRV